MTCVVILVGLPGSGKSYLVDKMQIAESVFVYSTDIYIEQCADVEGVTYSEVFDQRIREATEYMDAVLLEAIASNDIVVWDQTNTKAAKRKWILSQFPDHYVKKCFAISPPRNDREWELLYARLGARVGKNTPGYVLDSMLESYEEPTLEEGFSEVQIMSIMGGVIKYLPELT